MGRNEDEFSRKLKEAVSSCGRLMVEELSLSSCAKMKNDRGRFEIELKVSETAIASWTQILHSSGFPVGSPYSAQRPTFIPRARVLKLYAQALRVAKGAPAPTKNELMQLIRQEIENRRDCNDRKGIRCLIREGMERLKNVDYTLDKLRQAIFVDLTNKLLTGIMKTKVPTQLDLFVIMQRRFGFLTFMLFCNTFQVLI
ncbi:hypothetical protein CTI12_AA119950 [Artemisia annua]|uniref:Complex 1 LYR protein domain-containing protein n=1 Tax=Artemisia annua TaxID=35608 RepID=A0A2U1PRL8_ARTAN|nr:hypothetical protein CTI12_AA119950 [Artemisia annua]